MTTARQPVLTINPVRGDHDVVRHAAGLLSPRWNLTEDVAVVALYAAAADLGLEVTDLSALVVLAPS